MGIMEIGTRALQANQVALQTAGNNIANVNTVGYSRQTAILETVPGQFTGGGYIGKGVAVQTIKRNYSEFLTRQSTMASATASADNTRSDKLKQLEGIFEGGPNGLGASISDMLNSFSDVASAPTDLTARTVTLTRIDETASRMRAASQRIDDLQIGVSQELTEKITAVNALAKSIGQVNDQIAKVQGQGQPPNDLLDRRDQLITQLNRYVQTTSIPADDGTVGVFIGGSQALVLGTSVAEIRLVKDEFGDLLKSKLAVVRNGSAVVMDENSLSGGEIPGLLRFQNEDLVEGRNLLGRLTMAISQSMNEQHHLGLDLDGNPGGDLFSAPTFDGNNVLIPKQYPSPAPPVKLNTGNMTLSLNISDPTKFAASDYEINFDATGLAGSIKRLADGKLTNFTVDAPTREFRFQDPASAVPSFTERSIDGIGVTAPPPPPLPLTIAGSGDRYLLKPFSTSASNITAQFSTPRALAVASPVVGIMGSANTGSLQQISVVARGPNPPNVPTIPFTPVTLNFLDPYTYTRSDDGSATIFTYTPGDAIEGTLPDLPPGTPLVYSNPLDQWSVKLQGQPKAGDTFTINALKNTSADPKLNSGGALAMANLRDKATFDGAAMTDGYAGLMSQIGIRTQSSSFAATVSSTIAANLERDRTAVSGVNLDEEAAKLIQFQQAYQASAKMIQIAQNIFDTLIQGLGR